MPWTILRPTSVFGPRDRAFLPLFKLAARGVFLLPVDPQLPVTFLYVEDLARAVVLAADDPRAQGQTLFLGHREPLTAEELLRGLADTFGRRYRPLPVPPWALSLAGAAGDLLWRVGRVPPVDSARVSELKASGFVCAVERAREVLDFTANVAPGEGIQRTARWYRERDWL
jgi:nucleoside-diphosphate-sugar epimerase